MLKEIYLKNWKSFGDATLYIDALTILIGPNASGKSNALDALAFLNRIASGIGINAILQGDATTQGLRGGLEWSARKPEQSFTLGVLCQGPDGSRTDFRYEIEIELLEQSSGIGKTALIRSESLRRIKYRPKTDKNPYQIWLFRTDSCESDAPSITARLYNEKQGKPQPCSRTNAILYQLSTQLPRQEITEGVRQVTEDLRNLFILDPIPSHMREVSPLSESLAGDGANIAGVLAGLSGEHKTKVEATLAKYVQHIPERDIRRVYAEREGKFQDRAMLYCDESWGAAGEEHPVEAKGLSDGTLRFLAILTAILTRPTGSLLVVEEIDNGLHPSRSSILLSMLQEVGGERGIDILLTTHNPALLDAMGPEMVPFITVSHRNTETGRSQLALLEELQGLPKLLAAGPVGKLSSQGRIEAALRQADHG